MTKRTPEQDVIEAIDLSNLCQALHVLPRAGGLYDQDPFDVWRIRIVLEAQAQKAEMEAKKAKH